MEKLYRQSILLCLLFFGVKSYSQDTTVIEGWKYIPQNQELFDEVSSLAVEKQYSKIANSAFKIFNDSKVDSLKRMEARLFLMQSLWELGIKAVAIEYLKEIVTEAPGTFISQQALLNLNSYLPEVPYHRNEIKSLLNRGAFKEVPLEAQSLIAYFTALDNMEKGKGLWVESNISKIKVGSYWQQELEYFKALELVKKGDLKSANEALKLLAENGSQHTRIQEKSRLQRARVLFELKEYDLSEAEYLKYETRGRETGRILFERAIVNYHQKKYGTALGLLESLKSDNFKTAFNPDQVLLEMMIYRDLCHYPAVKKMAAEFEKKYSFLIDYLKKAQDLSKSQVLKRMILQNDRYKPTADLINQLRGEQKVLRSNSLGLTLGLQGKIIQDARKYENRYFQDSELEIKENLKSMAKLFFMKAEEIRLLEYISGLDENRIKSIFEARNYKAEVEERSKDYSVLYWPVAKEYWWDEYKKYQVLISDRCDSSSSSGGTKK